MSKHKPGDFSAKCALTRSKPEKDLTPEERAQAAAENLPRWHNRNLRTPRWEVRFPSCEGFTTEDPALFEAHMATEHQARPRHRQVRFGKGLWKDPRLTEDGVPFEPKDLEPGATVTWRELVGTGEFTETVEWGRRERREWVERTGQVWCSGWRPRSAWVIPFERLEGEQAVMVEQRSSGALEHYSTQMSPGRRAA